MGCFVFFPFFCFVFVLFLSGSINVHGAFFMEKNNERGGEGKKLNIWLLCFIHFMLEPVGALLHQERHRTNTLIGTMRSEVKGRGGDHVVTTTSRHPGCASSHAGGQSSQIPLRDVFVFSFLHFARRVRVVRALP